MLALQNITETVRHKAHKKRVLNSNFHVRIGPDYHIAGALYKIFASATKSNAIWVHPQTNDVLKVETALIDMDTGAVLNEAHVFHSSCHLGTVRAVALLQLSIHGGGSTKHELIRSAC